MRGTNHTGNQTIVDKHADLYEASGDEHYFIPHLLATKRMRLPVGISGVALGITAVETNTEDVETIAHIRTRLETQADSRHWNCANHAKSTHKLP